MGRNRAIKEIKLNGFYFKVLPDLLFCDIYWNRTDLPDDVLSEYLCALKGSDPCIWVCRGNEVYININSDCIFQQLYAYLNLLAKELIEDPAKQLKLTYLLTNKIWQVTHPTTPMNESDKK